MKELIKLDGLKVTELVTTIEQFTEKATETIDKILSRLPKDLESLDVTAGDEMEQQAMMVYSKVDDRAKQLKESRLEITRVFDDYKKKFTKPEERIGEKLDEIKSFSEDWTREKMRRRRIEDEKRAAEREKKRKELEAYNAMIKHYFNLSMVAFRELKQKTENAYYTCSSVDELNKIVDRLKTKLSHEKIKAVFQKQRDLNPFEFSDFGVIIEVKEVLPKVIENEKQYVEEYYKLIEDLINFYPSQVEKIKNQSEVQRKAEAEALRKKQEEDDAEMEAELQRQAQEEAQKKAIENLNEGLSTAQPAVEISKGVSVKLKYDCKTHDDLLRIMQWYVHSIFSNEDFEMLNKRLSFMRTAASKALNDTGEMIKDVPIKEDIRVRRTK